VTLVLAVPIYINAPHISESLLGDKADIALQATILLRYLCTTEFLFGLAMVLLGAMQGAGDTVRPLWISLFALWGLRVPLAVILSLPKNYALFGSISLPFALGMGAGGAWLAMAGTQGIQGILALIAFKQGAWKSQKV
jgi:Na+-driven multidrug efflux pump